MCATSAIGRKSPPLIRRSYVAQESAQVDREVRLIPYNGFPSDSVGRNGDLVLDQLSNTLYGPKADGVWPLEGVQVEGPVVCRQKWVKLSKIQEENKPAVPKKNVAWLVKAILRFLLTGRIKPAYVYSVHFKG